MQTVRIDATSAPAAAPAPPIVTPAAIEEQQRQIQQYQIQSLRHCLLTQGSGGVANALLGLLDEAKKKKWSKGWLKSIIDDAYPALAAGEKKKERDEKMVDILAEIDFALGKVVKDNMHRNSLADAWGQDVRSLRRHFNKRHGPNSTWKSVGLAPFIQLLWPATAAPNGTPQRPRHFFPRTPPANARPDDDLDVSPLPYHGASPLGGVLDATMNSVAGAVEFFADAADMLCRNSLPVDRSEMDTDSFAQNITAVRTPDVSGSMFGDVSMMSSGHRSCSSVVVAGHSERNASIINDSLMLDATAVQTPDAAGTSSASGDFSMMTPGGGICRSGLDRGGDSGNEQNPIGRRLFHDDPDPSNRIQELEDRCTALEATVTAYAQIKDAYEQEINRLSSFLLRANDDLNALRKKKADNEEAIAQAEKGSKTALQSRFFNSKLDWAGYEWRIMIPPFHHVVPDRYVRDLEKAVTGNYVMREEMKKKLEGKLEKQKVEYESRINGLLMTNKRLEEEKKATEQDAQKWRTAVDRLAKSSNCSGSSTMGRLYAGMFVGLGKRIGYRGLEPMMAFAIMYILSYVGILDEPGFPKENVFKISPSRDSLRTYFAELMSKVRAFNVIELQQCNGCFYAADKSIRGTTVNKVDHLIKIITFYNHRIGKSDYFLLDGYGSGGTSEACAISFAWSWRTFLGVHGKPLWGTEGDNGGGETGASFWRELEKEDVNGGTVTLSSAPVFANCTLHNYSLADEKGLEATLGSGGIGNRNTTQGLHNVKDTQNSQHRLEFKTQCKLEKRALDGDDFSGLSEEEMDRLAMQLLVDPSAPVMNAVGGASHSRWSDFSKAASTHTDAKAVTVAVAEGIIQATTTERAANKIASDAYSLWKCPIYDVDLSLVAAFSNTFSTFMYDVLKEIGLLSNVSSFDAPEVVCAYFVASKRLSMVQGEAWKTCEKFGWKEYYDKVEAEVTVENMNKDLPVGVSPYTEEEVGELINFQHKKATLLLRFSEKMLHKWFSNWTSTKLLFCGVGAQGRVGQWVAEFLCRDAADTPYRAMSDQEKSYLYERCDEQESFTYDNFVAFLKERSKGNLKSITNCDWVKDNIESIRLIAAGANFKNDPSLAIFKLKFQETSLGVPSNNQFVEKLFKIASEIDVANRDEMTKSELLSFHATVERKGKEKAGQLSDGTKSAKRHARGHHYGTGLHRTLEEILHVNQTNETLAAEIEGRHTRYMSDKKQHYDVYRAQKNIVAYMKARDRNSFQDNARTKVKGMDTTNAVRGVIPISALSNEYIKDIQSELLLRGVEPSSAFNRKTKITKLIELLKGCLVEDGVASAVKDIPNSQTFEPKNKALPDKIHGIWEPDPNDNDDDKVALSWIKAGDNLTHLIRDELTARDVTFDASDRISTLKTKLMDKLFIGPHDLFTPISASLKNMQPSLREKNTNDED